MTNPFETSLIVEALFKFLDFPTTLSLRRVSHTWNRVALAFLRKRELVFHVSNLHSFDEEDPDDDAYFSLLGLSDFITTNRLDHSELRMSLVTPRPWMHCTWRNGDWIGGPEDYESKSREERRLMFFQELTNFHAANRNDPFLSSQLQTSLLPRVAPFLLEMSLEIVLKDEEGVELFNNLLALVPRVKRLALDIYSDKDDLIQKKLSLGLACLPELETLSPRVSFYDRMKDPVSIGAGDHFVSESTWAHLLGQFPSIKYLDLEGWGTGLGYSPFMEKGCERAMRATQILHTEGRLPHLCGVRMPRHCVNCLVSPHSTLTTMSLIPLTELYLRNCVEPGRMIECARNFGESLETLDIHVQCWFRCFEWDPSLTLPHLPLLKSFIGSTQSAHLDVENHNAFGFASLFHSDPSQLETRLPNLSSLTLFYTPFDDWEGLWDVIFPETNKERHTYPQIQKLCISLVGECGHPTLVRILTTFPSLRVLRHMLKLETTDDDKRCYGMCGHSWAYGQDGMRKETVAMVEKAGVIYMEREPWEEVGGLPFADPYVFDEVMTPSHAHYFWKGPSQCA